MFELIKNKVRIIAATSLLSTYDTEELDAGKRFVAILAGAYIFQKGIRTISKHPIIGIQEAVLGGILLYNGTVGIHKKIVKKPRELSDIRKNQIQGNDPRSAVPAFV
ncbi:hypothetical protein AQ505_13755 [Pedobacter sp. PACM 27299]|uniref:hypothetical protein n=1 Tax=Pedobacter sp. PACM 27299 TaxID=1727164 RepID=UPI0007056E92|nr:hypothetical protein [Pedobacter sp. PACM 27299]ALL06467.1 hypothetical protein AQ505_13755 [Pedobacter sp. PACM 27299]